MSDLTGPTVEALHREKKLLLLSNGERGWITAFFDAQGDECEPHEAVACVGTDNYGAWYSVDLSQFDEEFLQ